MICCYNAARNNPYREHHHPSYTPLHKVPDGALKAAGLKFAAADDDKVFLKRPTAPADLTKTAGKVFAQG